ncbi:hypothetical protein O23A_p0131 [Aeromonas salmonicida]|nr:hypothetical protein O23A_p0131 [Aeromonas salmonicida]
MCDCYPNVQVFRAIPAGWPLFYVVFMVMLRGDCLVPDMNCALLGPVTGEITP